MSILVSDYDGTLKTCERDMHLNCNRIRDYIEQGNTFVLSSGRSFVSLKKQIKENNIPYSYIATCDGNILFDKDDNLLMFKKLSPFMVEEAEKIRNIGVHSGFKYTYLYDYEDEYDEERPIASISILVQRDDITDELNQTFKKMQEEHPDIDFFVYSYKHESYYMIKPKSITKATPISFLQRQLNADKKEIYTIGDNLNDFEMIRDYNGFMVGYNKDVEQVALKRYDAVYELVDDITHKKVLKRW